MYPHRSSPNFCANDPVAAAVEGHLHDMEMDGQGPLVVDEQPDGISLSFGHIQVQAENYDIALVRLAGVLLDDAHLGSRFMARLRSGNIARLTPQG